MLRGNILAYNNMLEPGTFIEYTYKDNRKNGEAITFDKAGKKKSIQNYKNGELSGLQKGFRESGALKDEYEINHDKPSIHKEYFENGNLKSVETYQDRKTIEKKVYDEEGHLILEKTSESKE